MVSERVKLGAAAKIRQGRESSSSLSVPLTWEKPLFFPTPASRERNTSAKLWEKPSAMIKKALDY